MVTTNFLLLCLEHCSSMVAVHCADDYGATKTLTRNDKRWLVALCMRYGVSVCVCVCYG